LELSQRRETDDAAESGGSKSAVRRREPGQKVAQVAGDVESRDDADGEHQTVDVADAVAVGGPAETRGDDAGKPKVSPAVAHVSTSVVHVCKRLFEVAAFALYACTWKRF